MSRETSSLKARMLLIECGIPLEIYDRLYEQDMVGPEERYEKLRITGKFEYSGQYVHLGGYDAQITPSKLSFYFCHRRKTKASFLAFQLIPKFKNPLSQNRLALL